MRTIVAGNKSDAATQKRLHRFWNEKPVMKFCVGLVVFVTAEVIVYVTLHWLIPIL